MSEQPLVDQLKNRTGRVSVPYHHVDVRVDARELARLREYEASKGMSISAIMRQALRVYDMMEQTPGAYEAVQKLNEAAKAVRELNRTTEETSVAADECPAHMSGCHVRDGSGICPNCKRPVDDPK